MESYPADYVLDLSPLVGISGLNDLPPEPVPADQSQDSPSYRRAVLDQHGHMNKVKILDLFQKRYRFVGGSPVSTSTVAQDSSAIPHVHPTLPSQVSAEPLPFSPGPDMTSASATGQSNVSQNNTQVPGGHKYRILVLEKNHVFPPRKSKSGASPLSPLNSQSPLFPDGIMTPYWVQKHKEHVPSVIVSFFDLWESIDTSVTGKKDPLGGSQQKQSNMDRDRDQLLASQITEKKKLAAERGSKFLCIILLKVYPSDDISLEERLSFLRKTCALERNALIVFSTRNTKDADLVSFIDGLDKTICDQLSAYFRDHEKRIKKKKLKSGSRPPKGPEASLATAPGSVSGLGGLSDKSLSSQGWSVRYDFKLGAFAEFRKDFSNAIKFYETAYTGLLSMLHQAAAGGVLALTAADGRSSGIHPFSKRWDEARTLVDVINIKIIKLHLLTGTPTVGLEQLQTHLKECKDLPEFSFQASSIDPASTQVLSELSLIPAPPGGGSFEYWGWVARQFRAFGEIIEIVSARKKLDLPFPPPGSATNQAQNMLNVAANTGLNLLTGDSHSFFGPLSISLPFSTVQHAGFYHLIAARCSEERWARFSKAQQLASLMQSSNVSLTTSKLTEQHFLDAVKAERAIDHNAIVSDLLTKAYSLYKKHNATRIMLYIASEIARLYEAAERFDMAMRFYERIGKTYRKEGWHTILSFLCRRMMDCALKHGAFNVALESIVELLSDKLTASHTIMNEVQNQFDKLLSGKLNITPVETAVDMDQIYSFIQCQAHFHQSSTHISVPQRFQIVLRVVEQSPPRPISVSALIVRFSDSMFDHYIVHDASTEETSQRIRLQKVDIHHDSLESRWNGKASLTLTKGKINVLESFITPSSSKEIRIQSVELVLTTQSLEGKVSLVFKIGERNAAQAHVYTSPLSEGLGPVKRLWYVQNLQEKIVRTTTIQSKTDPTLLRVEQRQPNVIVETISPNYCYLDEWAAIDYGLVNNEPEAIHLFCKLTLSQDQKGDPNSEIVSDRSSLSPVAAPRRLAKPTEELNTITVDWGLFQPGEGARRRIWVRSTQKTGQRKINLTLYGFLASEPIDVPLLPTGLHDLSSPSLFTRECDTSVDLKFESPFDVSRELSPIAIKAFSVESRTGLLMDSRGSAPNLTRSFAWLLAITVQTNSRLPIRIHDVVFYQSDAMASQVRVQKCTDPEHFRTIWKKGDSFSMVYELHAEVEVLSSFPKLDLGTIGINWTREEKAGEVQDSSMISWLEPIKVDVAAEYLRIYLDIPGVFSQGEPATARYVIQNLTLHVAELSTYVDFSEHFVFSGPKQAHYRVLPLATHILTFQYVPTSSGRCILPNVRTLKKVDASAAFGVGGGRDSQTGLNEISSSNSNTTAPVTSGTTIAAGLASAEAAGKIFPVVTPSSIIRGPKNELFVYVKPSAH